MQRRLARRILRHALWVVPALALGFLGVLWLRGGRDIHYVMRVLIHRESSTGDHHWKRAMAVAPSHAPVAWPEAPDCATVAAAFAQEPGIGTMDTYLRDGGALALVVVRDGALVCEWYGNGGARDVPAMAFSISKTVTALLLARAIADGKIASLDDPITRYVPELAVRDPRFATISLAHLVDMRSGLAFDEDTGFPWVDGDGPRVYYASDLATTAVERPEIEAPPGGFHYNDYAPNLIGLALDRTCGPLAHGPMQALWTALGAEAPAAWLVDDHGFAWHESGLVITARDLARIGQLMLSGGRVGANQVAPPAFVARSFESAGREHAATFAGVDLGYRDAWWVLDDGSLAAMGRYGQVMVVSPATHTVIVRMGLDGHDETNVAIVERLQRLARRLTAPATAH